MTATDQSYTLCSAALNSLSAAIDARVMNQALQALQVYRGVADRGDPSILDQMQVFIGKEDWGSAWLCWNHFLDTAIGAKSGEIGTWWHGEFTPANSMASKVDIAV